MSRLPLFAPWFPESYADAVREQILSGWVGPGAATQQFADEIAAYTGAAHCLPTTSGTVALTVAAVALGLKPGDEILVPAYGVVSTINAFTTLGLRPRLVDIDPSTGCMSLQDLTARIRPTTRAVCFVNFSGYTGANLVETASLCRASGLPLIEDAACAFGHRFEGRAAGSFGNVGIFSFSVPKIVSTGQGGALITSSSAIYERALCYTDQGDADWRRTNLIHGIGTNLRYNDILASFGLAQLRDIGTRLARKAAAYSAYREGLGSSLFQTPGESAPLHYIVFTARPDDLITFLNRQEIQVAQPYRALYQHPPYAHLKEDSYPGAEYWAAQAVFLPSGLSLLPEDAARVVDAVLESGIPIELQPKVE